MPTLTQLTPYLLVGLVLLGLGTSMTFVGMNGGNDTTRNELQKQVGILTAMNLLVCLVLGFLLYYYIQSSPSSFIPFTIVMITFNLFISIMAISVSVLQQLS